MYSTRNQNKNLVAQKDVIMNFNNIVSQNGNIMKFILIRGNIFRNHYLSFDYTFFKDQYTAL